MNNIRLLFRTQYGYDFIQLLHLTDGTKLVIQGQAGAGYAISTNYAIEVKKKSDLKDMLDRLVRFDGYILKDNYTDRLELERHYKPLVVQ